MMSPFIYVYIQQHEASGQFHQHSQLVCMHLANACKSVTVQTCKNLNYYTANEKRKMLSMKKFIYHC